MSATQAGILLVEMVGLTLSMASLILSLFIFCHFRNLWSTQTRLRKNLFIALGIQIIVRLIIALNELLRLAASSSSSSSSTSAAGTMYNSNQSIAPSSSSSSSYWYNHNNRGGHDGHDGITEFDSAAAAAVAGTEFLRLSTSTTNHKTTIPDCETTFLPAFLLEYTRNAMFLWMFLDGLYLHCMITIFPVIHERLSLKFYYIMGWATPIGLTFIWIMMSVEKVNGYMCWQNFMFTPYFWILEGPKLSIILATIFLLLNVIRILMTKLWRSSSPEVNQVRKAVSRSIILVPLLGITNYLHQMRHSPLHNNTTAGPGFTSWAYSIAFITSFQGVFAALIYCILNGEVQCTIRRWYIERRNEQREIIMVNGGPAGNCVVSSRINHSSTTSLDHHHDDRDSINNNGRRTKNGSMGLAVLFNWGKRKCGIETAGGNNCRSQVQDGSGETPASTNQLKMNDSKTNGDQDTCCDTGTINPDSISQSSSVRLDPCSKEHWNEVDRSAHCNVDIEHIEIPIEYFQKYNGKKHQQQLFSPEVLEGINDKKEDKTCPNCETDSRRSSAFLVELDHDDDVEDDHEEDSGSCTGADKKLAGDQSKLLNKMNT